MVWVCVFLIVFTITATWILVARLDDVGGGFEAQIPTLLVVGALIVLALARMLRVRAVPTQAGLDVYNAIRDTHVDWPEVVSVHLGERSWVQLDLSDGTTLAVMAIQRADGARGLASARRLAALVAAHEGRSEPPGGGRGEE